MTFASASWDVLRAILLLALLNGCASYQSKPLASDQPLFTGPTLKELSQSPPREFLKPVTVDLSRPLNANAIATVAVIANPDLKAQRVRAKVKDAQAFNAGLLPDATLSIGEDFLLSGPDTLNNLTAALGFDLNSLRTHAVAVAQAKAEGRQIHLDLAWAEWQTSGQARLQAVRILALQTQLNVEGESRKAQQALLTRTERAVKAGDLAADQLQSAQTASLDAENKYNTTERALVAARFELNRLLGLPPASSLALEPTVVPEAPPDAQRLYNLALAHRYDLAGLREGYSAQESALRAAVMDQFPALNLTINGNRDTTGNKTFGPAIDFTLPLWNRNRGGIAVEKTTREALRAEYDARIFQTRAEIAAAVDDIVVARQQRERLLVRFPVEREIATASAAAARHGDISGAAAEATQQIMRDTVTQLSQAEQEIAELTISLELLTGTPQEEWMQ